MTKEEFNKAVEEIGTGNKCLCKVELAGKVFEGEAILGKDIHGDFGIFQDEFWSHEYIPDHITAKCRFPAYNDYCEYIEYLRPLEKYDKLIIHCPTQEEYNAIVDLIGWDYGEKDYDYWEAYKEDFSVSVVDDEITGYADLKFYKQNNPFKHYTFTTAKEVLEEASLFVQQGGKVGIGTVNPSLQNPIFEELTREEFNNKFNKPMYKKLSFKLNKLFNADQKALYRTGLLDDKGEWTEEAIERAKEERREEENKKWLEGNRKELAEEAKYNLKQMKD